MKPARRSTDGKVKLRGEKNRIGMVCSTSTSGRTLKADGNVSGGASDSDGVFSTGVTACTTGEFFFFCGQGLC